MKTAHFTAPSRDLIHGCALDYRATLYFLTHRASRNLLCGLGYRDRWSAPKHRCAPCLEGDPNYRDM